MEESVSRQSFEELKKQEKKGGESEGGKKNELRQSNNRRAVSKALSAQHGFPIRSPHHSATSAFVSARRPSQWHLHSSTKEMGEKEVRDVPDKDRKKAARPSPSSWRSTSE